MANQNEVKADIPLAKGLDAGGVDPKISPSLIALKNAVFNKAGQVEKRNGCTYINAATGTASFLGSIDDKCIVIGTNADTADASTNVTFSDFAFAEPVDISVENIRIKSGRKNIVPIRAVSISKYSSGDADNLYVADSKTNERSVSAPTEQVEWCEDGAGIQYFYTCDNRGGGAGGVSEYYTDGAGSWTGPTLLTSGTNWKLFDAFSVGSYNYVLINDNNDSYLLRLNTVAGRGSVIDTNTALVSGSTANSLGCMCPVYNSSGTFTEIHLTVGTEAADQIYSARSGTDAVLTTAWFTQATSTNHDLFASMSCVQTGNPANDDNTCSIVINEVRGRTGEADAYISEAFTAVRASTTITHATTGQFADGLLLESKLMGIHSDSSFQCVYGYGMDYDAEVVKPLQAHWLVYRSGRGIVAKGPLSRNGIHAGKSQDVSYNPVNYPSLTKPEGWDAGTDYGTTTAELACLFIYDLQTVSLAKMSIDSASTAIIRTVEARGICHIPGAAPKQYDGTYSSEQGFFYYPELPIVNTNTSASSSFATGTITLYLTYQWSDDEGNKYESAPSRPSEVAVNNTTNVNVYVTPYPGINATMRYEDSTVARPKVYAALYMTKVDEDVPYQYSKAKDVTSDEDGLVDNFWVNISDDSGLTTNVGGIAYPANNILYTYGGRLGSIGPEAHHIAESHQGRYAYVPLSLPNDTVEVTQEMTPGVGTEYSDVLRIPVDPAGGAITSLRSYNEKLIIGKSSSIYITAGRGPDPTGASSPYDTPRLLSSSVGFANNRTAGVLPQGLIFLSNQGFYLLQANEQLSYIGRAVKYYTDTYNYTSTSLVSDKHRIVFGATDGPALVYDYMFDAWGTFDGAYDSVLDLVTADNITYILKSNGDMWRQSTTDWGDDTNSGGTDDVSLVVDTGWLNFDGVDGLHRIREAVMTGEKRDDHTLNIKVAYNHEPYWDQDINYDSSSLNSFSSDDHYGAMTDSNFVDNAYKLEIGTSRQKFTSFRMVFSDTNATPNEGYAITSLSVVGRKYGRTPKSGKHVG